MSSVLDTQEISAKIFALWNPPLHIEALRYFGYTEEESRFLYLVATHSGYFTCQQLVDEQGESRTQDCSRNPSSREDSDDARSVHTGRRR